MSTLDQIIAAVQRTPTDQLVGILGQIHRAERPNPLLHLVEEPRDAAAPAPVEEPPPTPPVSDEAETALPTARLQAHEDLVEHRRLLSDYGQRVARYLERVGAPTPTRVDAELPQQLVVLERQAGDSSEWAGEVVIQNPLEVAGELRFVPRGSAQGLELEALADRLGPGERTRVKLRSAEWSGDVDVEIAGRVTLRLCIEAGADAREIEPSAPEGSEGCSVTVDEPPDSLGEILREAQLLLLRYPLAAQALFRAFVAEGRKFGATTEGARIRDELADSELIRRGRVLWEIGTLQLLEEQAPTLLPGALLDAFVQVAAAGELEASTLGLFGLTAHADPTDTTTHE